MEGSSGPATRAPGAITSQVITDSFEAISRTMSSVVERTAVHPLFQELHDYSTGVCYYDGKEVVLVARATAIPAHIFGTLVAVEALVTEFAGDLHNGDLLMLNDPYYGGSHQADYTLARVIHLADGEWLFATVRAHMSDFGGVVFGGYNPDARDIWQEGYRVPPVRLAEAGVLRQDLVNVIIANSRLTETLRGDVFALISGCSVGARDIEQLLIKYGPAAVTESIRFNISYAAKRFRAEVAKWPDGTYVGERLLDHDSLGNRDIKVRAEVTVAGDELSIDLSGSDPQCPGYINSVPGTTISNALLAVCVVLPEDIPPNSGVLRQVKVTAPEGSVVNASAPAPVMSSTVTIGYEVADAVMKALEQVVPERVGEPGLGFCVMVTSGRDARFNDELYFTLDFGSSLVSAGGAYGTDGWGAWPASVSALILANVEMLELQYPFLFEEYEYADDSCAAGRWRGVPGFIMRRRTVGRHRSLVTLTQESHRHPMQGYVGGLPGAPSYAILKPGTPEELLVTESVLEHEVKPGEVIFTFKGGGGGWGSPYEREPGKVLEDMLDGYVSRTTAATVYGVVIQDGEQGPAVDVAATARSRATSGKDSATRGTL
jgi:N-methylhydantoinase B